MKELIKTILYEWRERKLPEIISRKVSLEKHLKSKVPKITVVSGFRRTGKTYLVFDLAKNLLQNKSKNKEQVIYINFEDERIPNKAEFLTELLPTIKETFQYPPEIIFLDEIQNMFNWSKWVRRIYDKEKIRIFITGSSSKMSSREIPTELRGRCLEEKVYPLSFKEFLDFKKIKIDFSSIPYSENEKVKLNKMMNEYLFYGGMPEVVLSEKENKFEIIQQYYKTVVRRDIIERFKIKNEEGLKALLLLLLNSTSYSVSKLYNTLKSLNYQIGKTTLCRYISYIENSYFLESVPIFSYKIKDQLQYPRKVYFIDNGFINALSTKFSKNSGRLYENFVFNELKRKAALDAQIFYWQDKKGREVDFVIKEGAKIKKLIQVSYDLSDLETKQRETKGLVKASDELRCNDLTIVNRDFEGEEKVGNKKIKFIPLFRFISS